MACGSGTVAQAVADGALVTCDLAFREGEKRFLALPLILVPRAMVGWQCEWQLEMSILS